MRSFPERCLRFITLLTGAASCAACRRAEKEGNTCFLLAGDTGLVLEEES